jgi:hypothetical protein
VGGYYIYLRDGFKYIPGPFIASYHKVIASGIMFCCYYSYYKACVENPGIISNEKQAKKLTKVYPYDDALYTRNKDCSTCKFVKPARSRHCRVCNVCIEVHDHHCIWINQCVGRGNMRWFMLFLFFHVIICLYGGLAGILIFMGEAHKRD